MPNNPKCTICGRALKNPESIARGFGPVCAGRKGRSGSGSLFDNDGPGPIGIEPEPMHVYPMSRPGVTKTENRSYLVRRHKRDFYGWVRVYPSIDDPNQRRLICDCAAFGESGECDHIPAVDQADAGKFELENRSVTK